MLAPVTVKPQLKPTIAWTCGVTTASGETHRNACASQSMSYLSPRDGASKNAGLSPYHAYGVGTSRKIAIGSISKRFPALSVERTTWVQPKIAAYPSAG